MLMYKYHCKYTCLPCVNGLSELPYAVSTVEFVIIKVIITTNKLIFLHYQYQDFPFQSP